VEGRKYVRNFADKAVGYVSPLKQQGLMGGADGSVVITRFTGAVIKSRPLKRVGAEQVGLLILSPLCSTAPDHVVKNPGANGRFS